MSNIDKRFLPILPDIHLLKTDCHLLFAGDINKQVKYSLTG